MLNRLPFNWKSFPFGYLGAMFLDTMLAYGVLRIGSYLTCYLVVSFLVLMEFSRDMKQAIETMNENWKINRNEVELMEELREIIWFNGNTRELSLNSFF